VDEFETVRASRSNKPQDRTSSGFRVIESRAPEKSGF